MARRGQHESKHKFLDAAVRVFRQKGYTATRVDDVCAAARLTKGSFFHHFDGKEQLALAAAEHFAAAAERLFAIAPYRRSADPRERLLGYVELRRELIRGEPSEFTCLLGTLVQEVHATHPAIRAACDRHLAAATRLLSADIAEAKRRYAPGAPWTPESLASFTQAVIQGAFVLAKAGGQPAAAIEALDHLRRYLETTIPAAPNAA